MKQRLSNLKFRLDSLFTGMAYTAFGVLLGLCLAIALSTCSPAKAAEAVPPTISWCEQWNTLGDEPNSPAVTTQQRFMFHLGFFLTKSDQLRGMIEHNNPTFDTATLDKIMTCYEENTPSLVEIIDTVCSEGNAAKQTKQVEAVLNKYISWCIGKSTSKA